MLSLQKKKNSNVEFTKKFSNVESNKLVFNAQCRCSITVPHNKFVGAFIMLWCGSYLVLNSPDSDPGSSDGSGPGLDSSSL
jgi:hypothetical protein